MFTKVNLIKYYCIIVREQNIKFMASFDAVTFLQSIQFLIAVWPKKVSCNLFVALTLPNWMGNRPTYLVWRQLQSFLAQENANIKRYNLIEN